MLKSKLKANAGFTLLEALVTVAVATGLVSAAVPALSDAVSAAKVGSGAETLFNSLTLARSAAIVRNARVVVCKSQAGQACTVQGDWEQGWIVFVDENNNGLMDATDTLLHVEHALDASIRLTGNLPVRHYVSYNPIGRTKLVSGAFQAGTFTVCQRSAQSTHARQVVINSVGRTRVARTHVAQCI